MAFTKEKEREIFLRHKDGSSYEVGLQMGFDKIYKNRKNIIKTAYKVYNKVKADYGSYDIALEVMEEVTQKVAARNAGFKGELSKVPSVHSRLDSEIQEIVLSVRDKSFAIMDFKLDTIMKSRKKMAEIPFSQLGIMAGISFDKGQILRGEATEHIAIHSKIEKNMSPEDLIIEALKMREFHVEKNNKK